MTPLEIELRLSLIRAELLKLADGLDGRRRHGSFGPRRAH